MRNTITILLCALVASISVEASAQQLVKQRIGTYKESGNVVVSEATTTLAIDLAIECEEFEAGPYARYAQKYLGKRASLVSRVSYDIIGADIAVVVNAPYLASSLVMNDQCTVCVGDDVAIDRLSADEQTQEAAAAKAAEKIYSLRAAREDLVMGEYGDGVYGAGLDAALREIDRLEQEYLKLFYGVRTTTITHERILLPVSADTPNSVVARFNSEEGLLAKDNVSGDIVLVAITPSDMTYPAGDEKGRVAYRYANNATVVVSYAQQKLASRVLPIFEFGKTVYYAAPSH